MLSLCQEDVLYDKIIMLKTLQNHATVTIKRLNYKYMNRKTLTSILSISAVLIIGIGALTFFVYYPNKDADNDPEIMGARTSNQLESVMNFLTLQIGELKGVERTLKLSQPILAAVEEINIETQMNWVVDARLELLNHKAKSKSWNVPGEANASHSLYMKMLDEYILMYESFFQSYNQEIGESTDAQFALVDAERSQAKGNELMNELKIANGELLKSAGAKFSDTDKDTLPDVWEQIAGSDITLVDTDEDGLTDAEEFNLYLTKPDKPDTDADGFIDGVEVTNGFNPIGDGKLLTR